MSIPAVGFAFAQHLPATQKWLLVCLADYADEWGDSIFASLEELTDRTSLSRATLQRTFRELLTTGVIVRVAKSTPFSPPFYRIVMPEPEPGTMPRRERDCPNALRAAVKYAFHYTCEYCHGVGTPEKGPDGHRWTVDRLVPGKSGGRYVPKNVTLACRFCNTKKRTGEAPAGTRSLAEITAAGHQNEAPVLPTLDRPNDTPEDAECDPGGLTTRPDPLSDPEVDPLEERTGAAPRRPEKDSSDDNIRVITKIAHEVLDLYAQTADVDLGDIVEAVKRHCAVLDIAYAGDVIQRAIESALYQRQRAGKPSVIRGSSGESAFRLQSEAP